MIFYQRGHNFRGRACSQSEDEKPSDAGHWPLFSRATIARKHSQCFLFFCFCNCLLSVLTFPMSLCRRKTLARLHALTYTSHTHTHTHTYTLTCSLFARARLGKRQSSVLLASTLQTHLHIKKEIYPGEHSMCLYKTGGCLLFMCELAIELGGG